jgi:hypothetical protein
MTRQACPNCGEARLGYLRFCLLCGFDYDRPGPDPVTTQADLPESVPQDGAADTPAGGTAAGPPPADAPFEPFDLFPARTPETDAAPGGMLTGVMVVAGIVVVFVALLVLRPLG